MQFFFPLAIFTVTVSSSSYQAELCGNVTMECRFPPGDGTTPLSLHWNRLEPDRRLVVYQMVNGHEHMNSQDSQYRGRVHVKKEELRHGRAVLQISDLRMSDSGKYQCVVELRGVDYKQTTLAVKASYRNISATALQTCSELGGPMVLECHASGFPLAQVEWTDASGPLAAASVNTSYEVSADGLYAVTSRAKLNASCGMTYKCTYVTDEEKAAASIFLSASSQEESLTVPKLSSPLLPVGCTVGVVLCVLVVLVVLRKSSLWSPQGTIRKKRISRGSDKSTCFATTGKFTLT
ncbi:programmed cell death 1 ligand 1-like [Arapaima gigas]